MKKVGFFGGTFDPIHFGHLNLAVRIMELKGLDQVLFCPAHVSPTKVETPPEASAQHRLNMLQLALEGLPHCYPCDVELRRPPPSFTIDTLRAIQGEELYLIVSEEAAADFWRWKEIEEVLKMAPPLVGARSGYDKKNTPPLPPKVGEQVAWGRCEIPVLDISSMEVRERLKQRRYCGHLVPGKVLDYIYQNVLYSPEYG